MLSIYTYNRCRQDLSRQLYFIANIHPRLPFFSQTPRPRYPSVFSFISKIYLPFILSTSSISAQAISISYLDYCKNPNWSVFFHAPSGLTLSFHLTSTSPTHPQFKNIQYFLISLRIRSKPITVL